MKDYIQDIPKYVSKEEKQKIASEFILKYQIINEKIIVHFVNGEKLTYDYSQEREQQILEIMKQTFEKYALKLKEYYGRHLEREALNDAIFYTGLAIGSVPLVLSIVTEPDILTTVTFLTIGLSQMGLTTINKIQYMKRYQDFAKSLLFFQNEERINFQIENNLNFAANTMSKKHQKYLVTKPDGSRGYTINSIDKMSLVEFQKLLSRIEFEEQCMRTFPILSDDSNHFYNSLESPTTDHKSCKQRIKRK